MTILSQESNGTHAATEIQVEKRESITTADLQKLLNEGWQKWHAEYKGNNLNVVLTRVVPVAPAPEPEQKAVVEAPVTTEPVPQPSEPPAPFVEPVGTPLHIHVSDPVPTLRDAYRAELHANPRAMIFGQAESSVFATMTRAEQYRAESNERILDAMQDAILYYRASKPAYEPAPFGLTLEVSRV